MKVFFIYAIFLAIFATAGFLSLQIFKNQPVYLIFLKFYTLIEYSIIASFLYFIIQNKIVGTAIKYSIFAFVLICIYFYFLVPGLGFNKYPSVIEFLLFIAILIYFFYEKMKTVIIYPLYQSISFWICVAFFLYFSGNFFFFLFNNPSGSKEFKVQMKIIYSFVTITKNIILSLSLLTSEPSEFNDDELHIPTDINLDEFTLTNPKKL